MLKLFLSLIFCLLATPAFAAVSLTLTWTDNSSGTAQEQGFRIERKIGTTGTYSQIGTTGPDVATFNDTTVALGTQYCYRVRAYNAAGDSAYSNEACATTPAIPVAPSSVVIVITVTP